MAAFNKYNQTAEIIVEGVNLGSDTLKIALSNTAPDATDTNLASASEIAAGNGYSSGGATITITSSAQSGGTYSLVGNDVVFTASGGTIGPFRYAILYNSTTNQVLGWWDYGSSITLNDTETFTVDFGSSILQVA